MHLFYFLMFKKVFRPFDYYYRYLVKWNDKRIKETKLIKQNVMYSQYSPPNERQQQLISVNAYCFCIFVTYTTSYSSKT